MQDLNVIIDKYSKRSGEGLLFVISGPSAVGKGTVVKRVLSDRENIRVSVSATTRSPRTGEEEGVHYYFMSDAEFKEMADGGGFLEYAFVHGHYYGTPKKAVEEQLAQGNDVILEIDVQGAAQVKDTGTEAVYIFVMPPSMEELRHRFDARGTESPDDIELRMGKAAGEIRRVSEYDYCIVNDDLDAAVEAVESVISSEHHKIREEI